MDAFRLLYASHVRPSLEYGGAATYPCTAGELDKLERPLLIYEGPAMKVVHRLLVCSQLRIDASWEISSA
ncbi:unnamed protein product [Echinostoma caproni]|uniref:Protein-tyrosine-phosphatase n=1 Tax=Echinostoma caproni TaxID=27848 RepID=A0A183AMD6_9TREM|nr:unnamed protein product [Echinostoma caproni]